EPLTDLRTRILRRLLDYLRLEVARLVAIHRLSLPCVRNRSGKNNSPSAGLGHGLACGKRGRLGRVLVLRIRDHVIGLRLLVQGKRALEVALPQRDRAPVRSLVDSALTSPLDGCFRTRDEVPADGDALLYMEILGLGHSHGEHGPTQTHVSQQLGRHSDSLLKQWNAIGRLYGWPNCLSSAPAVIGLRLAFLFHKAESAGGLGHKKCEIRVPIAAQVSD